MKRSTDNEFQFDIHDERNHNKITLEASLVHWENQFEDPANTVIQKLEDKLYNLKKSRKEFFNSKGIHRDQLFEPFINVDDEILSYEANSISNEYYLEKELWALWEMKIIYLYKHFEIGLKALIKEAYSLKSVKEFYRWDSIVSFLLSKKIKSKELSSYAEVMMLREINNSLKHSDTFDEKLIQKVPEFRSALSPHKGNYLITYHHLGLFYNRISDAPSKFLYNLKSKLYDERYQFDSERIDEFAEEIVYRMEKKEALELVKKLEETYNFGSR